MELKIGDYVKVLKNGEFFKIVQIKNIYGNIINTTHGIYFVIRWQVNLIANALYPEL